MADKQEIRHTTTTTMSVTKFWYGGLWYVDYLHTRDSDGEVFGIHNEVYCGEADADRAYNEILFAMTPANSA
jgi:hypothetical protein